MEARDRIFFPVLTHKAADVASASWTACAQPHKCSSLAGSILTLWCKAGSRHPRPWGPESPNFTAPKPLKAKARHLKLQLGLWQTWRVNSGHVPSDRIGAANVHLAMSGSSLVPDYQGLLRLHTHTTSAHVLQNQSLRCGHPHIHDRRRLKKTVWNL